MPAYAALLRAVNVGGTGKLPMSELQAMCEAEGYAGVRTYIASGNVVFHAGLGEAQVKAALERRLQAYAGKPVRVLVRTAAELARILAANPFPDQAPNRTVAIFLDHAPPADALAAVSQQKDEQLALGEREIYVAYGAGMADSRLRIPAGDAGTARNMNTVARLAAMAAALDADPPAPSPRPARARRSG
ncbi:DUF1697 domain-containing protein [Pseudoxanthomonas suwonensis]|uniref:DUF1697 domain-containing protein n=1 Tax=Pseudoxanthomonas suwonensis TaxID=314722 RepID=A0A0E3Z349_9GAMM|nr:DUF1697 domain-containing protein [Pseudoxanthomonas suwonensis]AKC86567.1 hypothetical protein WQ53_07085 [Pseudoxanthomonas suwonensis]